jgi:hypothetical protein
MFGVKRTNKIRVSAYRRSLPKRRNKSRLS